MISGIDWRRRGLPGSALLAAIPTGDAPRVLVIGVPPQDRLNDRHIFTVLLQAIEEEHGLAVVVLRRRGDVPFAIDLAIVGTRVDVRIFNPGVADVGRLNCQLIGYLFSVGGVTCIGARLDVVGGSIRVLDDVFILPHNIPLSQVRDAAWMEVAEWRDDITCRNCRWAVWSSEGESLGRGHEAHDQYGRYRYYNYSSPILVLHEIFSFPLGERCEI